MASALTFLERDHKDGDEFLNHIIRVTGDETWVSFVNANQKEVKAACTHFHQTCQKSLNKSLPARKLVATVFWDRKGVLMMEFKKQRTTTSQVYCKNKMHWAIQNRRRGMLTYGVMLLHDNAHLHRTARI
jgi:hypothetical protein